MTRQQASRADIQGQRQGADLHQLRGRDFLKLLAWPAFCWGLGIVLFLAVYAAQLMGWVS